MSDVCRLFIEVDYLIRIPENSIYIDRQRQRQRQRERERDYSTRNKLY